MRFESFDYFYVNLTDMKQSIIIIAFIVLQNRYIRHENKNKKGAIKAP